LLSHQRIGEELGTSLLEFAEKKYPSQLRILVSGYPNTSEISLAISLGTIYSFIQKPWIMEELKIIIDDGLIVYAKIKQLNKKKIELKEKLKNYEVQIKLLQKQLYN
jgi:response regulator RpfG family c-di-GMP phosphodiesterase